MPIEIGPNPEDQGRDQQICGGAAGRKGPFRASFFSTLTTFGAPLDVTTQDLRIESFFPADVETPQLFQALGAGT